MGLRVTTAFGIAMLGLAACICNLFISNEVYLIPEGTEGDVYIVTNVKAAPHSVESREVVFVVPSSRVILTSFRSKAGLPFAAGYYYVKADGSRTPLPVEDSTVQQTQENLTDDRPFIWFPRTGAST